MTQIYICLLLLFTSVFSYPITNYEYDGKNSDNIDFSNEFWSKHFGLDFKDAVHLDLQQTDLIDTTGNNLQKHIPESQDNTHKKRSTYVVHTPQVPKEQNNTVQSSMKVHLLEPAEIEALEKQMLNYAKENRMSESPVVVNLPAIGDLNSKSFDHETPMVLNIPPVVYHSNPNSVHSHYFDEHAKGVWSKNPKLAAYHHGQRTNYHHQLPKLSYEKMMMLQKQKQKQYQQQQQQHQQLHQQQQQQQHSSYEKIMQALHEKNLQAFQENQNLMGHSIEKTVQPSFEEPSIQPPQGQVLQASHEMMVMQPSYENMMQPSQEQATQPLYKQTVQPLYEKTTQSPIEKKQPSTEKPTQPSFEQIQTAYTKMMQPSYDDIQPSFEQIQDAYAKMMHPSYDKMEPSYEQIHPTPAYGLNKQSTYEGSSLHPSYENTSMFPYDGSSMLTSLEGVTKIYETTEQSLKNAENIQTKFEKKQQPSSFEDVLGVKDENHDKTT